MSDLIAPIITAFQTLLQAPGATANLPPFGNVFQGPPTGVLANPPASWVMPVRTQFPDQGDGNMRNQIHLVTVRLGIVGTEPEELTVRTMAYVQAVDAAIGAYTGWPDYVLRAWVAQHDYGPMFKLGSLAYWPDLHCQVEVEELS